MRNLKQMTLSLSKKLSVLAVSAVLAACAVGPDYKQPETKSPDQFVTTDATQVASADVEGDFWKAFNDEELNSLIEEALAANHDIRIAMANLREARAIRGEAQLDFAPTVTASGGYTESRLSERQSFGFARNQNFYDAGFDAFWELDFFGRVRRNVEANSAQAQAAEAGVYNTQVSVTAEVARNYFELRGSQQRLAGCSA